MQGRVPRQTRLIVDIPVTVTTVLNAADATVADLSEEGALITGHALPEGMRFQIEYMGQTVFAQVRWSEIDRMGVQFPFPLTDGPLFERLLIARATQFPAESAVSASIAFAPHLRSAGFGRRGG